MRVAGNTEDARCRCERNGSRARLRSRLQADPRRLNLLVHPLRQTEVRLVRTAVRVANDRRHLKATGKVERGRGVVEHRLDLVAAADIERQLDPRVHLRLVELREVAVAAPVVVEERAGVGGIGRVHAEGKQPIAVEVERELVGELDRHGRLVVAGACSFQAEVVDPGGVLEGFVDRAVAVDEPWGADAIGVVVPAVGGRRIVRTRAGTAGSEASPPRGTTRGFAGASCSSGCGLERVLTFKE